jgi:hypothetical protein
MVAGRGPERELDLGVRLRSGAGVFALHARKTELATARDQAHTLLMRPSLP